MLDRLKFMISASAKCLAIGMALMFAGGEMLKGEMKEEAWAFTMDFETTPDRNLPAWRKAGAGEAWLEDGKLHLRSEIEAGNYYILSGERGDAAWDGSKASTVRFRARVIYALDGVTGAYVSIRCGDRIFNIPVTDTSERTYHFLFQEAGDGRLFIDGLEQPPIPARPMQEKGAANAIAFGDLGRFSGGETEWLEFRWTNDGAFEP